MTADYFQDEGQDYFEDKSDPDQEQPGFWTRVLQGMGQAEAAKSKALESVGKETIQAAKGAYKGATLGLSQLPGTPQALTFGLLTPEDLKPEEGSISAVIGEGLGSLLPISKLYNMFSKPLVNIAMKSPILQRQLSSLARLTGSGLTGATVKGIETSSKGEMPSVEDMFEHGVEWTALDAILQSLGYAGRFVKGILKKSKSTGKQSWETVNELMNDMREQGADFSSAEKTAAKALSILEKEPEIASRAIKATENQKNISQIEHVISESIAPDSLKSNELRYKKMKPQSFKIINENSNDLSAKLPEHINPEKIITDISEESISSKLNEFHPATENPKELGETVQKYVNKALEKSRESYKPKYETATKAAKEIKYKPTSSIKMAESLLEKISSLKTKPTGYQNVINVLQTALEDLGQYIGRSPLGNVKIIEDVPVDKMMELAKRLNEVVNYDVLESTIKDRIKPLINTLKKEIRMSLKPNSEALKAFEEAEQEFAKTSKLFGRENIRNIREIESPEKIEKILNYPSALEDLSKVMSPEEYKIVERNILQKVKELPHEKASKFVNGLRKVLTEDARKIAQDIVESKLPLGSTAQKNRIMNATFDDLASSIESGTRPEKALKLWQTPEGQNIIKQGLKNNPNSKEILSYLEKQSMFDFAKSIIKDGEIDFKKFNKLIKDKAVLENIRLVGGEDAVKFFTNLENYSKRLEKNLNLFEKVINAGQNTIKKSPRGKYILEKTGVLNKQASREAKIFEESVNKEKLAAKTPGVQGQQRIKEMAKKQFPVQTKLNDLFDFLGVGGKTILAALGVIKFGGLPSATGYLVARIIFKLAKSKKFRDTIKNAASKNISPIKLFSLIEQLDKEEE